MYNIKSIENIIREKYPLRPETKKNLSIAEYTKQLDSLINKNVPPRFKQAQITDKRIEDFLFNQQLGEKGLFLYGECGTGKTHNFYGIYKTLRLNFEQLRVREKLNFTNINDFFSEIKQTFDDPHSERNIVELIKEPSILFFDDFGSEKSSEWTTEALYRLINHRYEYMLPTFISSNHSLSELAETTGDRIPSRIAQMCDIIKFEGEDKRITKII